MRFLLWKCLLCLLFCLAKTYMALGQTSCNRHHLAMATSTTQRSTRRKILGHALRVASAFVAPSIARGDSSGMPDVTPSVRRGGPAKFHPFVEGQPWDPAFSLQTRLAQSRINSPELSPLNPSLSPFADNELYYAPFLFGEWNVTATLKRKTFPYGTEFVPSRSLIEGSPRSRREQVNESTNYQLRFFSTLANNIANRLTVNLGTGVPRSKIIADRSFDAISISKAYRQLTPVQEVEWNPTKDPTRLTLNFGAGPLGEDMRPLGERRGEVYITARHSESVDEDVFCASERSRSVVLAPGNVVVSDTESITEYRKVDSNHVNAISTIAVYLTPNPNSPEGVLWQQVGGKAVAFFDYELQMTRNQEEFIDSEGRPFRRACVRTPKDFVQCE
jgi:hypothetical protein